MSLYPVIKDKYDFGDKTVLLEVLETIFGHGHQSIPWSTENRIGQAVGSQTRKLKCCGPEIDENGWE